MACRFPGAQSLREFWENVLARRQQFRRVPDCCLPLADYHDPDPAASDKTYLSRVAVLDGFHCDSVARRIPQSSVESSDIVHWLALETAPQALEDAGYGRDNVPTERAGVLLGNTLTGEQASTTISPRVRILCYRVHHSWRAPMPVIRRVVQLARGGLTMTTAGMSRRDFIRIAGAAAIASQVPVVGAQGREAGGDIEPGDRVFIANEDSNTISVIDPARNAVDLTINLTSFDEDPRPPFRLVTGGVMPTHSALIHKPLYHGCIDAHGVVPAPDGRLLATCGRGSSNVYLIDTVARAVVGNTPNPFASAETNAQRLTSGILVGREPHEPTFTRNGKELWIAVRGEDRIAILDLRRAVAAAGGGAKDALLDMLPTLNGPAQVWFDRAGAHAFVVSQKVPRVDVFAVRPDADGYSHPERVATLEIAAQDKPGFTPFEKSSPDGGEIWFSHKLADAVSVRSTTAPFDLLDLVPLGEKARPNHLEFVENPRGRVVYVSLARVDDDGPGGVAASRIAIVDRAAGAGSRRVVGTFFSQGREAHGLWANPANTLLYVAHEQDELPDTPSAGQTVATAFDVTDPLRPRFVAQIPLGGLRLPSGELRNKKSINLVYVRPGQRGQTA